MVGRTDVGRRADVGRQLLDGKSVAPDRHGSDGEASVAKDVPDRQVSRILQGHVLDPQLSQQGGEMACDLLGACADDDLLRRAAYAPGHIEVACDLRAQRSLTLGVPFEEKGGRVIVQDPVHALLPLVEVETLRIVLHGRHLCSGGFIDDRHFRMDFRAGRRYSLAAAREDFADVVAGLGPGVDIALHQKLVVALLYRSDAQGGRLRKASKGWKLLAFGDLTCQDQVFDVLVELQIVGLFAGFVEYREQGFHGVPPKLL